MNKIMAYLQGGLGNQCFIYAAARALALRTGAELSFCGDYFQEDKAYKRSLSLDAFKCAVGDVKTHCKVVRMAELARYWLLRDCAGRVGNYCCDKRPFKYHSLPDSWHGTLTLDGYFQSEKYFYDQREQILKDLTLKDDTWIDSDWLAQEIANTEHSIFVHVRSYKEVPGKENGRPG